MKVATIDLTDEQLIFVYGAVQSATIRGADARKFVTLADYLEAVMIEKGLLKKDK